MQEADDEFLFSVTEADISDLIHSKDSFHFIKAGMLEGNPNNNTFDNLREQVDAECGVKDGRSAT